MRRAPEPDSLADLIRERVASFLAERPGNVAAAVNVGADHRSTSVQRDDDVTILECDGESQDFRHHADDPG